jgi:hypothetical protein
MKTSNTGEGVELRIFGGKIAPVGGSPIKRHLSREKSIPAVRGLSSSPFVVRIGVGETN